MRHLSVARGQIAPRQWLYTMPAVAQIAEHGLDLDPGITVLIGENGSGKSTVVEALAAAWGRRITAFRQDWVQQAAAQRSPEDSDLHRALQLQFTRGGPTGGLFLRAERLHAQIDSFSGPQSRGRWNDRLGGERLLTRSHGEGFLQILSAMTAETGLYILDEPESALSFDSCLVLLALMADMRAAGSQIVLATHSPVLAALPGSHLLQLDADGIHPVDYDDSHLVTSWRSFLSAPDRYLRHLT